MGRARQYDTPRSDRPGSAKVLVPFHQQHRQQLLPGHLLRLCQHCVRLDHALGRMLCQLRQLQQPEAEHRHSFGCGGPCGSHIGRVRTAQPGQERLGLAPARRQNGLPTMHPVRVRFVPRSHSTFLSWKCNAPRTRLCAAGLSQWRPFLAPSQRAAQALTSPGPLPERTSCTLRRAQLPISTEPAVPLHSSQRTRVAGSWKCAHASWHLFRCRFCPSSLSSQPRSVTAVAASVHQSSRVRTERRFHAKGRWVAGRGPNWHKDRSRASLCLSQQALR
mmetsp:Transcript_2967/g.6518  ORF Transcript_2967/g.6518 Transcript_2967/m.6518 type:complete len:276 (+) Transcript_2967:491-1318(+)